MKKKTNDINIKFFFKLKHSKTININLKNCLKKMY